MSIGPIVDTAIGLIFVYLLLGLIVSALQEAFAATTKLRGKYLLEGTSRLLADHNGAIWRAFHNLFGRTLSNVPGTGLRRGLGSRFWRGLLTLLNWQPHQGSALFQGVAGHALIANSGSNTAPSYVSAESFVTSLTDALRDQPTAIVAARLSDAIKGPSKDGAPTSAAMAAVGPDLLKMLADRPKGPPTDPAVVAFWSQFGTAVAGLTNASVQAKLQALLPTDHATAVAIADAFLAQVKSDEATLPQGPDKVALRGLIAAPVPIGPLTDPAVVAYWNNAGAGIAGLGAALKAKLQALLPPTPPAAPAADATTAAFIAQVRTDVSGLPAGREKTELLSMIAAPPASITDPAAAGFLTTMSGVIDRLGEGPAKTALRTLVPRAADPARIAAGIHMRQLADGIEEVPAGPAKTALRALHAQSLGALDDFKARLGKWFDTGMERVSGVYKRFTQYFTLAFGLIIAVIMNVDSVRVAEHLWTDDDARAAVVAAAEAFVENVPAAVTVTTPGANGETETTTTPLTPDQITDNFNATLDAVKGQLAALPLPIGRGEQCDLNWWRWLFSGPGGRTGLECEAIRTEAERVATLTDEQRRADADAERVEATRRANLTADQLKAEARALEATCEAARVAAGDDGAIPFVCVPEMPPSRNWFFYVVGWLLTGFAVSLGAPFWFDLLNKFMRLRGAGARATSTGGTKTTAGTASTAV